MEDNFIIIGKIISTHGVKGGMKVYPLTDDPNRFKKLKKVYLEIENNLVEYNVSSASAGNKYVIVQLENVNNMDDAEKLKNIYIKIHKSDAIKLPKNSYFIYDLIGMNVNTVDGRYLGKIVDIINSGANDVYIIEGENKQLLIPAIKDVVKDVDIDNKSMTVELLKGLEEL